jgi:fructan beta-fructosidase
MRFCAIILISILFHQALNGQTKYNEQYRPQIHFSPRAHWMNDPNGMVYNDGIYHLFFQYYPDSTVWGPMHWGHATSSDMIHWEERPIALDPDSLGYIFSGSAVVDIKNTSGFGKDGKAPLVAIYTSHNIAGERAGTNDFQTQSIAYSLDNGNTWTKYESNPVIKNPGIKDFRDPKIMWYEEQKKWIMILAVHDHVSFYSSPNLKTWTKESDFGQNIGAHGGVWECPDIFSLADDGKKVWVLISSINPGAPNGGSGTQYFVGFFNGKVFTPVDTSTRWIDYGADDYAGVTWSNTGERKVFLGWMSNWDYAQVVPTVEWRSAMTIPRELRLEHVGDSIFLASKPVQELNQISFDRSTVNNMKDTNRKLNIPARIDLDIENANDFSITLSNDNGEEVVIGFDKKQNQYFIDRTKSGNTAFYKSFAAKHTAPRLTAGENMNISLIIDVASVELFADDGLTVMTEIFFPSKPCDQLHVQSTVPVKTISFSSLKSIWHN